MDVKEILSFLGMDAEKVKTVDEFKAGFQTDFIKRSAIDNDDEIVGKIYGKKLGTVLTHAKRTAKTLGVELSAEETKDKSVEDLIELIGQKAKDKHTEEVAELKKLADKSNNEETIKEYQKKIEKLTEKNRDYSAMVESLRTENETVKTQSQKAVREFKLNSERTRAFTQAKFKKDITPLERKGFEATFNERYELDLDENEAPFIKEKATGKRINSAKKAGDFATIDEILEQELATNKLIDMLPKAGAKPVVTQQGNQQQQQQQNQQQQQTFGRVIKINPAAEAAAQKENQQ